MPIRINGPRQIALGASQPAIQPLPAGFDQFDLATVPGAERIDFLDCYFLIDTTGSMKNALANVAAQLAQVIFVIPELYRKIQGSIPDIFYGFGWYKDFTPDSITCFSNVLPLTHFTQAAVDAGVFNIALATVVSSVGGGGDEPECQVFALNALATQPTIGWRAETLGFFGRRLVVWVGDAPGHDPSGGVTTLEAIFNLNAIQINANAISVGGNGLNGAP